MRDRACCHEWQRVMQLLLAMMLMAAAATAPATEAGTEQQPVRTRVVVQLGRRACNPATGKTAAGALERAQVEAAAQGLTYLEPLPLPCWHIFTQAAGRDTDAAIDVLRAGDEAAAAASGGADKLFALVGLDRAQTVPTPRRAGARAAAPAAEVSGAAIPVPECSPGGVCSKLWGVNRINVRPIWQLPANVTPIANWTRRGCVIDQGVDFAHLDMAGQLDSARSATFNENGNLPAGGTPFYDLNYSAGADHGTLVMGILAGGWGNGDTRGIAGIVGPAQSSMVSCNAFSLTYDDLGPYLQSFITDSIQCMAHAAEVGAIAVVNLSLEALLDSTQDAIVATYRQAFKTLICDRGGIAVISAGNDGIDISTTNSSFDGSYPAKFALDFPACILAVAATTQTDELADFSNYGLGVGIAAPGVDILSDSLTRFLDSGGANLWRDDTVDGTSFSAPLVAGVALLIRNAFPTATAAQVVGCLKATATQRVNTTLPLGGGIMDAAAAFACVRDSVVCAPIRLPACVEPGTGTVVPSCKPYQPPRSSSKKHGRPGGSSPPLGGPKFYCVRSRSTPGAWCRWSLKRYGVVCRAPTSACDSPEVCKGGSPDCPPDRQASPGTPCHKGNGSLAAAELVCLVPGAESQSQDRVAATAATCAEAASEGGAGVAAVRDGKRGSTFACGRCSGKGHCIDEGRWRCRKPL